MPLIARTSTSPFAEAGTEDPDTRLAFSKLGRGSGMKNASRMPLLTTVGFVSLVLLLGVGAVFLVKRVRPAPSWTAVHFQAY